MPTFKYKARNAEGKAVEGVLEAESEQELSQKLDDIGMVLVDARAGKVTSATEIHFGRIKRRDIVLFTNHVATSVEAGVPVIQAISDYARETEKPHFKRIVEDVERQVMAGTPFSEALARHPKAFSDLYVSIVATGEATGNLDMVLRDLVGFMEWQEELAAQVKQASIYPSFLLAMIIVVVVIMMTVTMPKFIPVLKGFNVELPAPTRILISTSEFFQAYWYYLLIGIAAFIATYKITYRTAGGKAFWDLVKLNMPLFGRLHHKLVLSKFAHYFSILYSSGIGIIEAFTIIERVVGNEVVRAAVARARDAIEQGETIYEALKREDTFPPLVLRMIQVGETTGKLDTSLQKASDYYDKEVPNAIKKMFAVFEPMLIIFMGGIVLFIAMAVFLPLYKLTSTIGTTPK